MTEKFEASNIDNPEIEPELRARINEEFERYVPAQYEGIRRDFQKLAEKKLAKVGETEAVIAKRQKDYEALDLNGRIWTLTNNFYLWWPGGWYRQLLEDREKDPQSDPESIKVDEKLVVDLDDLIREGGHENMNDLMLDNSSCGKDPTEWNLRMRVVADIYFKMRDKGYDEDSLRK